MASPQIQCPAGEIRHPTFSRNKDDVLCRLQGNLRPARWNGQTAICCANYADCQVWKMAKQISGGPSTKAQRDALIAPERGDVLVGSTR